MAELDRVGSNRSLHEWVVFAATRVPAAASALNPARASCSCQEMQQSAALMAYSAGSNWQTKLGTATYYEKLRGQQE
jgi:hypothetical protein